MPECSELSKEITKLAMNIASDTDVKTLDDVIEQIQRHIPYLSRDDIVNAIVEVSEGQQKKISELQAKLQQIKKDARAEKDILGIVEALEEHIENGTLEPVKERAESGSAESVKKLRALRDQLRAELRKTEPARLQRIEKSIADMIKAYESGEVFQPKVKEEVPIGSDLAEAIFRRDRLRAEIRAEIRARQPKGVMFWAKEPFNISRAMIASVDFSAVLRQGGFVAFGHPVRAAQELVPMFKATFSDRQATDIFNEIMGRPNAPLYARAKLYIAPVEGGAVLSKQEEYYMSALADKIPWVRASERAYITFLNKLRADSFDAMVESLSLTGEVTQKEAEAIANYINVATGRGDMGKLAPAAQSLNTIFFAPRYVVSRFQLVAGQPLYHGTARTRGLIAKEYARYILGLSAVYTLGLLAGADLEPDPRSADFGKLRFGDTRLDPLSGMSQAIVLISRVATGQTKSSATGEVKSIRGDVGFGMSDTFDILANFTRTKFSPLISVPINILTGTNVVGEPVTPGKAVLEGITPLSLRDVYDAMIDQGMEKGAAMGLLSIFGVGLMVYQANQDNARAQEKLALLGTEKESKYETVEPDYYQMSNLSADLGRIYDADDIQRVVEGEEADPYVVSWAEMKTAKDGDYSIQPGKKLYQIVKGLEDDIYVDSIDDYREMWQERSALTTDEEREQFDAERMPLSSSILGNMTDEQFELLKQYAEAEDREAFLDAHPELKANPRVEWLKANPKENALLAVWGQAKLYSVEAIDEAAKMIEELGIAETALDTPLPDKELFQALADLNVAIDAHGANSTEVSEILLNNEALLEATGKEKPSKPIEYYELYNKWTAEDDEYNALDEEGRKAYLAEHTDYADDRRRRQMYGYGQTDPGIVEQFVKYNQKPWVEAYGNERQLDDDWFKLGEGRALYDYMTTLTKEDGTPHPDAWEKIDESRVPPESAATLWRDWQTQDQYYYEAIPEKFANIENVGERNRAISAAKEEYLAANRDYWEVIERRDAWDAGFPEELHNDWVGWYMEDYPNPIKTETNYNDDWYLAEHPEFYSEMVNSGLMKERDFSNVPTRQVATLLAAYEGMRLANGDADTDARNRFRDQNPLLDAYLVHTRGYKARTSGAEYLGPQTVVPQPKITQNQ